MCKLLGVMVNNNWIQGGVKMITVKLWLKYNSSILLFASVLFIASCNGEGVKPVVSGEASVCTMDAMQCPDGSWSGRSGPECKFVCAE